MKQYKQVQAFQHLRSLEIGNQRKDYKKDQRKQKDLKRDKLFQDQKHCINSWIRIKRKKGAESQQAIQKVQLRV